jgi:Tfp pilus assembly protein PilF
MTRSAFPILLFIGASFVPAALHAQCAPSVQQLITDRKYDGARSELQSQLERAPHDDAAMHCMGRLLLEQGKPGDAVDWLEKAAKINGKSAQHQLWLGNALGAAAEKASVFKRLSFAGRVKTAYEEAVALDPTLVDARRGLVMVYSLLPGAMGGSMPKAREQAAEILKLNPMRGHLAYGTIAEREKDFTGAEKEFRAAITTMPDSAIPYNATGGFFRRQKRWTDASAMYQSALKAKPEGMSVSIAHYYLGVIHQENGRRDQAKAEYQAALAANPNNEDAAKALASLKEN